MVKIQDRLAMLAREKTVNPSELISAVELHASIGNQPDPSTVRRLVEKAPLTPAQLEGLASSLEAAYAGMPDVNRPKAYGELVKYLRERAETIKEVAF
ncbi:hypothetical protein HYX07_01300 [Candidatus Woesearchaeota archaeon]|nr:hypothetical protein [Candidatus Woesearchaeota archaeon]